MKVLFLNSVYKQGSTGNIIYHIKQELEKSGYTCIVLTGGKRNIVPGVVTLYSDIGAHLHSFLSRKLCMQGLASVFKTIKAVMVIRKEKPDVINIHNIHGHYLNYPILFSYLKQKRIPIVWSLHDCWAFTGNCSHYTIAKCDKWKRECKNCKNLSAYPNSEYDGTKRNYRLKKKYFTGIQNLEITCDSQWLQSQVKQSFLGGYLTHVVYPGIDTRIFRPLDKDIKEKYGIPNNKKIVLCVSSVWKKEKGLDTIIELSKVLRKDCCIVMVGINEQQVELLPKEIVGILRTENVQDLAYLYSSANVMVNPSEEECFGMVIAEAMACGTPVIVSNRTACPESLTDQTGMIVDMSDIKAVNKAVCKMVDSYPNADECVKRVNDNFTLDKMTEGYIQVLKSVLEKKK